MPTEKKLETVQELVRRMERCTMAASADYLGLPVSEMVRLRRQLREAGVEVRVIKNSLFRLAAQQAGRPELAALAEGPTAIAFAYGDIVAPARALVDYQRAARNAFAVRRAVAEGQVLSASDVEALATLPPREVLVGQVVGGLKAPLARLSGLLAGALVNPAGRLLSASLLQLRGLLEARAAQLAPELPAPLAEEGA